MGAHSFLPLRMRQHVTLVFLVALSRFGVDSATHTMDCKYDSKKGATYDLTKLKELTVTKELTVRDRMTVAEKDYQYTFGICTTVAPPKNCQKDDGTSRVDPTTAPGWQTNASQTAENTPNIEDRQCAYLGNRVLKDFAKWSLLDSENPGAGVTLTYTEGQHCSSGQRRQLALNFKCSKSDIEKIDRNVMDESEHCKYEITIESEYACPTECGFGGGHSICNKHGVCGYDADSAVARCFCNEGYSGHGCDTTQETEEDLQGYGPILGLLIFVTIALVVLVAAVVGLWRFMSK